MAAPTVASVYPADGDTGIPVGATLLVYFDRGVDLETVKNNIALYGSDFDQTSGPDQMIWLDQDTGDNPYFLSSPGFSGVVPLKVELRYYSLGTTIEVNPGLISSEADEIGAMIGHVARLTVDPDFSASLAADTRFTLHIMGNPDDVGVGVSCRTVFDVEDVAVAGSGSIRTAGTYSGSFADTVHVKITQAGDIGVAKFKWWYASAGEGSAETGRVTSSRFRKLQDGLQVRFTSSGFLLNDEWRFNVEPVEYMETSTKVVFTTNDGSYTAAPESPSTPATSLPASSVLPTEATAFDVKFMDPAVGSYNISQDRREITITFTEDVDPATITDESIKLYKYPVSGVYQNTFSPVELEKTISVSGNVVTINFQVQKWLIIVVRF